MLNLHTVKALDTTVAAAAADETGLIVTAEEHQVGGFGNLIAGAILTQRTSLRSYVLKKTAEAQQSSLRIDRITG